MKTRITLPHWFRVDLSRRFRGFTMIELIVVLAIVSFTSTIVLFSYGNSRQVAALSATALDIASVIRLAQASGRSSSQGLTAYDTTQELLLGTETARTGVEITANGTGDISKLTVYRGINVTQGFQLGSDVVVEIRNLASSSVKARLCRSVNFSSASACPIYGGSTSIEFSRLASDPFIEAGYNASLTANNQPVIQIETTVGNNPIYRYIVVERTGNIFVR